MRTFPGLTVLALAVAGAAHAQAPMQAGHVLLGLVGHCWQAEMDAGVTDTHCFTEAVGGELVMDVHKVRSLSGRVVYEGVTLYRVDAASGAVRYDYYNSTGDLLTGYAKRDGQVIRFPAKPDQAADVVWYLGTDAYEVGTAAVTATKRKFAKAGPAPAGGF